MVSLREVRADVKIRLSFAHSAIQTATLSGPRTSPRYFNTTNIYIYGNKGEILLSEMIFPLNWSSSPCSSRTAKMSRKSTTLILSPFFTSLAGVEEIEAAL